MKRSKPIRLPRRKPTRKVLFKIYQALRKQYGHRHWWPGDTPFEVMVGAILTQNTAWINVERAIQNLRQHGLLTPQSLLRISQSRLAKEIRPAGYFNVKAVRLKNFVRFFFSEYGGSVKRMSRERGLRLREKLLKVNGIGEETADSILLYASGKPFFVVDAYTRRVFMRHRYLKGIEKYQEIQALFERLLPRNVRLFNDYHAQIVQVGKDFCRKAPRCGECPLQAYL